MLINHHRLVHVEAQIGRWFESTSFLQGIKSKLSPTSVFQFLFSFIPVHYLTYKTCQHSFPQHLTFQNWLFMLHARQIVMVGLFADVSVAFLVFWDQAGECRMCTFVLWLVGEEELLQMLSWRLLVLHNQSGSCCCAGNNLSSQTSLYGFTSLAEETPICPIRLEWEEVCLLYLYLECHGSTENCPNRLSMP